MKYKNYLYQFYIFLSKESEMYHLMITTQCSAGDAIHLKFLFLHVYLLCFILLFRCYVDADIM